MKIEYQRRSEALRKYLNGWLPANLNTPVLDMGCGKGNFLYFLEKLGYTDLTGVDLDGGKIREAEKRLSRSTLIEGDAREILRQHSQYFGLLTAFDVIEHFPKADLKELFALVVRALAPGGRVIFQTPNAESPWVGAVAYGDLTHEWFFTPASPNEVLAHAGLTGETRPCGPYVHGVKSCGRVILWRLIQWGLALVNLVETVSRCSGIYTRVFLAMAEKK